MHIKNIFRLLLTAAAVTGGFAVLPALAQTDGSKPGPAATLTPYRYRPNRFPQREAVFYQLIWGIDTPQVKWAESGELIRFSWHVLDPSKARQLNDKKFEPSLIDPEAHVTLVVPSLEKVGLLRQTSMPEAGKSYWMAFSNRGRTVKRGDRVILQIGQFRADGLIVE